MSRISPPLDQHQRLEAAARELASLRQRMLPPLTESSPLVARAWPTSGGAQLNAPLDTRWAYPDPRFMRVLHLFHQEWHGIRAAAGYSPGQKLAITSERLLSEEELRRILEAVDALQIDRVLLHGNSDTADQTIRAIRSQFGPRVDIGAVWHGNTAQFSYAPERQQFEKLLGLKAAGIVDRIAAVKPGMCLIFKSLDPELIFVFPPHRERLPPTSQLRGAALIPVPDNWRKNFYTNLYAGALASRLHTFHVTTSFARVSDSTDNKTIVEHPHLDRSTLFGVLGQVDLILNASLSECQPMTALEGLVHGVPCITNPLGLGDLERHPYAELTQVAGVDAIAPVHAAIERILDWRQDRTSELAELMADYHHQWLQRALMRLGAFAYP